MHVAVVLVVVHAIYIYYYSYFGCVGTVDSHLQKEDNMHAMVYCIVADNLYIIVEVVVFPVHACARSNSCLKRGKGRKESHPVIL
jgi:hypothetical protein